MESWQEETNTKEAIPWAGSKDMQLLDIFGKSIGRKRTIFFNYPEKPIEE